MTTVVNLYKEPYDVYIGRGSIWGNPFIIGKDGTREEVIAKYKARLLSPNYAELRDAVYILKDKRLGCYCKPKACHGDVLVEYVNNIFSTA